MPSASPAQHRRSVCVVSRRSRSPSKQSTWASCNDLVEDFAVRRQVTTPIDLSDQVRDTEDQLRWARVAADIQHAATRALGALGLCMDSERHLQADAHAIIFSRFNRSAGLL